MDAVYLYNKYGEPISHDLWTGLTALINWVCVHWNQPDEGIWEVRGGRQHFLFSRLMCWAAVDRGIRLAQHRSFPAPYDRWQAVRAEIYEDIFTNFWDPRLRAFVQRKGAATLDASTLLMPLVRFISPTDPRWLSTLAAIEESLVDDSLVYRYRGDETLEGLSGREGTFCMCTFWFVECLGAIGRSAEGALPLRESAGLCESPRPVRRGARSARRAPRELPAGVHPPGAHQRGLRSRSPPLTARVGLTLFTCRADRADGE